MQKQRQLWNLEKELTYNKAVIFTISKSKTKTNKKKQNQNKTKNNQTKKHTHNGNKGNSVYVPVSKFIHFTKYMNNLGSKKLGAQKFGFLRQIDKVYKADSLNMHGCNKIAKRANINCNL